MAEENRPQTVADVREMLNKQNDAPKVDSTPNPKFQEAIQGTTQDQKSVTPGVSAVTTQDDSTQSVSTEQTEPAQDDGKTEASKQRTNKGK